MYKIHLCNISTPSHYSFLHICWKTLHIKKRQKMISLSFIYAYFSAVKFAEVLHVLRLDAVDADLSFFCHCHTAVKIKNNLLLALVSLLQFSEIF